MSENGGGRHGDESAATAAATAAAVSAAVSAAVELIKRDYRLDELEKKIAHIEQMQEQAQVKLAAIETAANRWKGGFLAVVALGGIVGWLSSIGSNVARLWK